MDVKTIEELLRRRTIARGNKDYDEADRIRGQLDAMGVAIEDGAGDTRWRVKT